MVSKQIRPDEKKIKKMMEQDLEISDLKKYDKEFHSEEKKLKHLLKDIKKSLKKTRKKFGHSSKK